MNNKRIEKYKRYLSENQNLARPLKHMEMVKDDVLETSGWYVFAPTMHMFIVWVLQQAMDKKVKRLYFLARDAYLMVKTAEKICQELKLPIECRYFYCSRFSLRTPLFHYNMEQALDYICANGLVMNLEVILERTGLSKEQQEEVIHNLKTDFKPGEDIPFSRLKEVRESLRECELFISYFTEYSKGLTPNLLGYLNQEGLLEEDTSYAVVDSGWVGSTQKTFNEALRHCGVAREVKGFYWGLYDLPTKRNQKDYYTYYFGPGDGLKEKVHFSSSLFEAIFSAPHGTTTGYEKIWEEYKPIYSVSPKKKVDFIQRIEDILAQYTDLFIMDVESLDEIDVLEGKKIIYKMLKLFMAEPSMEEADYFGNLIFSDYIEEDGTQSIAAKFTAEDMKKYQLIPRVLTMLGLKQGRIKESGWPEGSIVLFGGRIKYNLLQSVLYKGLSYTRMMMLWKSRKD